MTTIEIPLEIGSIVRITERAPKVVWEMRVTRFSFRGRQFKSTTQLRISRIEGILLNDVGTNYGTFRQGSQQSVSIKLDMQVEDITNIGTIVIQEGK